MSRATQRCRQALSLRAAREREQMGIHLQELAAPLRVADQGLAVMGYLKRHPIWTAVVLGGAFRLFPQGWRATALTALGGWLSRRFLK
jgi:hypothetical protein